MTDLFEKYGYCIIPKNTYLYRTFKNTEVHDSMFFTLKSTYFWRPNGNIKQVWKTSTEIKIVFLVKYLNESSWAESSIVNLYNDLFPNDLLQESDDLLIKQNDFERRSKFTNKLYHKHQISGWFSSIENNAELEVCLFDKLANSSQIELVYFGNEFPDKFIGTSLKKIKIFPNNSFLTNSNKYISEMDYKTYKASIKRDIQFEISEVWDKKFLQIDYFDLRLKLKI